MNKKPLICLTILFVFSFSVLSAQTKSTKTANIASRKILEVTSVTIIPNKKISGELIVRAKGQVNVTGWTKGKLRPRFSPAKPAVNGIYRFDFIATPPDPSSNVAQVVSSISATYTFKTIPEDLKRMVVFSETNKVKKNYELVISH